MSSVISIKVMSLSNCDIHVLIYLGELIVVVMIASSEVVWTGWTVVSPSDSVTVSCGKNVVLFSISSTVS